MGILKSYKEFINENVSQDAVKEWKGFYLWWADDAQLFRIIALDEAKTLYPDFKDFEISDMTKEEANVLGEALTKMDPMEWEDYLNEVGYDFIAENTNIDRSLTGFSRFGIDADKTKYPQSLLDYITNHGYEKIPDHIAGFDNVVDNQIYYKDVMNGIDEKEYELSCYISDHGEGSHDIVFSLYSNKTSTNFNVSFKWEHYNELIKFIDNYDLENYENIMKKYNTFKDRYTAVKYTFKDYTLSNYDIDVNY